MLTFVFITANFTNYANFSFYELRHQVVPSAHEHTNPPKGRYDEKTHGKPKPERLAPPAGYYTTCYGLQYVKEYNENDDQSLLVHSSIRFVGYFFFLPLFFKASAIIHCNCPLTERNSSAAHFSTASIVSASTRSRKVFVLVLLSFSLAMSYLPFDFTFAIISRVSSSVAQLR